MYTFIMVLENDPHLQCLREVASDFVLAFIYFMDAMH